MSRSEGVGRVPVSSRGSREMIGSQVLTFTMVLGLATLLAAYAVAARSTAMARLRKEGGHRRE